MVSRGAEVAAPLAAVPVDSAALQVVVPGSMAAARAWDPPAAAVRASAGAAAFPGKLMSINIFIQLS